MNSRGWCKMHYSRWQRTGTPLGARDPNNLAKDRPCIVEDCDNLQGEKGGRGWCTKHYQMWFHTGDPLGSTKCSPLERFMSSVNQSGPVPEHRPELGRCWQWTKFVNDEGYATFRDMRSHKAHRWSYEQFKSPIPHGLVIDHLCRNPSCVNPDHLEAVTNQKNLERGWGRRIKNGMANECINGHEFTVDNTYYHPKGSKVCRTCTARSRRKYELKKKEAA